MIPDIGGLLFCAKPVERLRSLTPHRLSAGDNDFDLWTFYNKDRACAGDPEGSHTVDFSLSCSPHVQSRTKRNHKCEFQP